MRVRVVSAAVANVAVARLVLYAAMTHRDEDEGAKDDRPPIDELRPEGLMESHEEGIGAWPEEMSALM